MRRLPVIQNQAAEDAEAADRPASHWIAIGATLIFSLWLPLAMVATWAGQLAVRSIAPFDDPQELAAFIASASSGERAALMTATLLPPLVAFGVAATSGGALVGRFGGDAGQREAAIAGASAAGVAALVAVVAGGTSIAAAVAAGLLLAAIGAGFATLGARLGLRRRPSVQV